MTQRFLVVSLLFLGLAPAVWGQDDVILSETRPIGPAQKNVLEALVKTPAEAPLKDVKDDITILVNHVVYPMTTRDVRDNPVRMSRQVEFCEGRIRNFFQSAEVKNTAMQDEFLVAMTAALKRILVEAQQ